MPANMEQCPVEIIESIVQLLGFNDICNLRISCRSLAAKSSNHSFKRFFQSKHVDFNVNSLLIFSKGIATGRLPASVQRVSLVGIAHHVDKISQPYQESNSNRDELDMKAQLLSEAFSGIAKCRGNACLSSLTLRVAVISGDKGRVLPVRCNISAREIVWQATTDLFATTMHALAASKLKVQRLCIFNDPDLQRCSLACDQLNVIDWDEPNLKKSLSSLTALSISLSNPVSRPIRDIAQEGDQSLPRNAVGAQAEAEENEANFTGFPKLLSLCVQLEDFELHYFHARTGRESAGNHFPSINILQRVVELDTLPSLIDCRLRGISAREEDLLRFIQRTRVRKLSLQNVKLVDGTFKQIFDYITSKAANVIKLHFDILYEPTVDVGQMIFFVGGGISRLGFPSEDNSYSAEMLEREGESVQQPITYFVPPRWAQGNPFYAQWRTYQRTEYG